MSHITYHPQSISLEEREHKNGHRAAVLWFTGLSGSGKSTVAMALQEELFKRNCQVSTLDGDNVRQGLNAGLGFTDADRVENLRRVSEVSKLFAESGFIVLTSFISPFKNERERAREIIEPLNFFEIYVNVDLATAEERDPKGLYKKARAGEIKNFTGLDSPYEAPEKADLVISNAGQSVQEGVEQLISFLESKKII
ncbi:MAG: adenylyl-sulfate kinase [Candidatus Marinimicrobia bacterium]|nr:adenylyl-sulfate kinase [Candidatus Neomarinimicrobiota bacterium]